MDARWQAQQSELKNANLAENLQQAYNVNCHQNTAIFQLQGQVGNLQTIYSRTHDQKARLEAEIKGLKNAYKDISAQLDRVQMDKEVAWQAVQKMGELLTGIQSETENNRLNINDNVELRDYVRRLVIDNKKQEGEINHLKGVVDKLKKFRSIELAGEMDGALLRKRFSE
jgi:septal ring factor EnvC (AmiA/AmiB activator)